MQLSSKEFFRGVIVTLSLMTISISVSAHHSFAVHFFPEGEVTVTGVVTSYRFANPHGVVELTALDTDGQEVAWRAETNSPSMLRRRGWTRESIKVGEEVTLTGWPARADDHYLRIRMVTFSDGSILATQPGVNLSQD